MMKIRLPNLRTKKTEDSAAGEGRPSSLSMGRILFLGTIGGGVFLTSLWQGFPHHQTARFILREFSESGGVGLAARDARFDFPARVDYADLDLLAPTPEGPTTLRIDRASAHLELASLLQRKPRFNFRLRAYGGEFDGLLRHLPERRNHLRGATTKPLDLGLTRPLLHQDLSGAMTLRTDYTWKSGAEMDGHGVFSASIANLVLKSLTIGGFPLPPVAFDSVRSRVFLSGGRGRLEQLMATGPLADVTGDGTFILAQPPPNSILHLRLLVRLKGPLGSLPLPGFSGQGKKPLTVTLDGPASNLNIAMNGIPIPH
ncbi:MAG: type II secretion system protein GspN [Nitrospirae bacterium]|nr:type II secretion system protein GspN [Nitrospirota bacterium]